MINAKLTPQYASRHDLVILRNVSETFPSLCSFFLRLFFPFSLFYHVNRGLP
jgi:hypothetical protein